MIRVAIVIDSLRVGGAQRLVSTFAAKAPQYGIAPVIVRLREDGAPAIMNAVRATGVEIVTMPASSLFNYWRLQRLTDFLKSEGIDLVQTHLFYSNILGSIAAHRAGLPVISTLHSTTMREDWKGRLLQRMENYCLQKYATRVLAVGNMVAQAHARAYPTCQLDVIPNGIPEHQPVQLQERERVRHAITGNGDKSIIVTVGRFAHAKGYDDMIEAFNLLHQKDVDPVLLMVGTGSTVNSIKARIEDFNLNQSVVLVGERNDVPKLLASSDVYASSSHREGLPLAMLEAMMAGLPIVATAVGDVPSVVTKETGVVVPPHEPARLAAALEDLLKDPQKRQAMGNAARQRAQQEYSVDAWMKKHVALYQDLLSSRKDDVPR